MYFKLRHRQTHISFEGENQKGKYGFQFYLLKEVVPV